MLGSDAMWVIISRSHAPAWERWHSRLQQASVEQLENGCLRVFAATRLEQVFEEE
jgi:hypothetical protein